MITAKTAPAQNSWHHSWILSLILLLILAIALSIWVASGNITQVTVRSDHGSFDLRDVDFDKDCAALAGSVEYVPYALLTPAELETSTEVQTGKIPQNLPYLTSRIRLLVPDDRFYEVAGFADDFGTRLYINGKWLMDIGQPAAHREGNIPSERFVRFTAEPKDGVIEIVQQTSNFVFRSNTSHTGWTIGRPEIVERWATGFSYSYVINIGFYLALFLIHFMLFFLLPEYKENLWFCLLCLLWALRTGFTRVRPIVVLLDIGWTSALRLEYLTAVSAIVLVTLGVEAVFPKILPKQACHAIYILGSICAVFYLLADTLLMTKTMIICEIVSGVWALYVMLCVIRKQKELNMKQRFIVVGLGVILIALLMDTLYYNHIVLPFMHNVILETAMLIFFLFQMVALFLDTVEEVAAAREAEQRLALENAALDRVNCLKTDLLATISHEMRTPLAVMMGFAQLVASDLKDKGYGDQVTADLDAIAIEARRLSQLVEEMQGGVLARQWEPQQHFAPTGSVIQQLAHLYAPILERKGTALKLLISEDIPDVHCSPNELMQVLFNLLNNADRHTKHGMITIMAEQTGCDVTLVVADTGTGIPAQLLPHVFERYRHGESGGTGLGLSICKQIVDSCGGRIEIESSAGSGTIVRFSLPVESRGHNEQQKNNPVGGR